MCGIAGYICTPSTARPVNALSSAVVALGHRGPDDSGIFEDPAHGVGLAHTRLSILDLSPMGHQPMRSGDGRVVLVFNGEIYNFRELRTELEALGHSFCGHSDTEVLLTLYMAQRHTGNCVAAMLRRLNGMFAFALWDSDRGELLLARDALGVKPLYYSTAANGLAFASELKALQHVMHTAGELDAAAIDRYLSFLWCPGDGTPVRDVHKLGPGEAMWVRDGVVAERIVWYRLPVFGKAGMESMASRSRLPLTEIEAIRGTELHLRQAVHRQMIADVPVGAFLSGGLDSGSVVAFAREQDRDIRCFTVELVGGGNEDEMLADLPYARRVAKHLGVDLVVVPVDAKRMAEDLPTMVRQLDEPLADPAALNVLYISRLAREHGIKVLLSGVGGDDLFTGYRRHQAVMAEGAWAWLPLSMRVRLMRLMGRLDQRRPLGRRLRKLFSGAALEGDARLVNFFRWVTREDLMALYTLDFRAALGEARSEDTMLEFLAELDPNTHPLERMLALEQRFFLADHNLNYTDKMAMAAGVEVRVPFLDLDLVEFAARIPPWCKQRGSEGKWVLKKAMEPYLPHDVIYRPKTGFGAPLRHWLRYELREWVGDMLSPETLRRRGLFDPKAVAALIEADSAGRIDGAYTILGLICIELWCREFVDKRMESRAAGD